MRRFASPILALVVGVAAGYWIGYTDAWRGPNTLGARFRALKDKVHPDMVSEQRKRNAEKIRDNVYDKSGLSQIP